MTGPREKSVDWGIEADASARSSGAPRPGRRVWLVAPGENAWEWDDFVEANVVAIGWDALGDFRKYPSREALSKAIRAEYGEDGPEPTNDTLACWQFAYEMQIGKAPSPSGSRTWSPASATTRS